MMIEESGNGLDNLTNSGKPSIAYSVSCDNTPFDCLTTKDGNKWDCRYNMGEAFTVASKMVGRFFLATPELDILAVQRIWNFCFSKD